MRAEYLGEQLTVDSIRRSKLLLYDYLENGWVQKPTLPSPVSNKKSISVNGDGSQSSEGKFEVDDESKLRDPKYLLEIHGYDSTLWELINSKSSHWDTQVKGGDVVKLYSLKVTVKPKKDKIDLTKIKNWYDSFKSEKILLKDNKIDKTNTNCLVLPISDLHFNMLATTFIAGNEYNKEIAKTNFYKIVNDTCERIKNKNISKVLFVLGNDMFNSNGLNGTTFKGTPQFDEGHNFEAYIELSKIVINAINTLSDIASTDIIFVPSNHDKEIAYYFMYTINTYFRNNENITVDYVYCIIKI